MAEYMAVFIDSEQGVFKRDWVNNARLDYTIRMCMKTSMGGN